jgi:hypothetical protein
MAPAQNPARYRKLYALVLHLYPKSHRERYSESMEQTFSDLLRERDKTETSLLPFALWIFAETLTEIIKTNVRVAMIENKRIIRLLVVVALILMIPLVAMQFTDEVDWTLSDFVGMGMLLLGAGLTYEFIARRASDTKYRIAVGIAVATGLILIWMNLAVGIIGSEDNPANLLYGGVIATGFFGAIIARFRAKGMSYALFATATAQALVPIIALLVFRPSMKTEQEVMGVVGVLILNSFYVALFLGSGLLFRDSARQSAAHTKV